MSVTNISQRPLTLTLHINHFRSQVKSNDLIIEAHLQENQNEMV
jgi:hypothetical protein